MKNGGKMLFCVAGSIALVMAARAAKSSSEPSSDKPADTLSLDNPYGAIVERNIFDLHDPPPPKLEADQPKGPPPNIKLNGITTIFGMKQALISLTKPGAAGKPPTTIYLTLSEGQRKDDVEVLEINPKARTTKIKNEDVESLLNIETNRAVAGGPPPAGGAPGTHAPAAYAQPSTAPGFQPHNPYGGAIPARPTRTDSQPGVTPSAYNQEQNNPGYNGGGAIPTQGGTLNPYGGAATQTAAPTQQPQLSALEQYTLMEAQRAQALSGQADPNIAAIMPPTPLGQALNPQNEAAGGGGPPAPPAPAPQAPGVRTSGSLGGIYVPGR